MWQILKPILNFIPLATHTTQATSENPTQQNLNSPWPLSEQQLITDLPNWSAEKLKAINQKEIEDLVGGRRWVEAARLLVLKRREAGASEVDNTVRQAVKKVRNELDDLVRSLDKNYGQAQQISPAFQWAQNSTHIFLSVKYAARWNAPGALEVKDAKCEMNGKDLFFTGTGEHSMIVKQYTLNLKLKHPCKLSSWGSASVGRMSITLEKEEARKWNSLLDPKNPKVKYGTWESLQDQINKKEREAREALKAKQNATNSTDTVKTSKKKKKKKGKKNKKSSSDKAGDSPSADKQKLADEEPLEEEDEEDIFDRCEKSTIFEGSKVKNICEKNFDLVRKKKDPMMVMFFDTSPKHQRKTHDVAHIFKSLAGTLPTQHCRMAVVDCDKEPGLCQQSGITDQLVDGPVVGRYADQFSNMDTYSGEINMERLAEFAVKGEQIKMEL